MVIRFENHFLHLHRSFTIIFFYELFSLSNFPIKKQKKCSFFPQNSSIRFGWAEKNYKKNSVLGTCHQHFFALQIYGNWIEATKHKKSPSLSTNMPVQYEKEERTNQFFFLHSPWMFVPFFLMIFFCSRQKLASIGKKKCETTKKGRRAEKRK